MKSQIRRSLSSRWFLKTTFLALQFLLVVFPATGQVTTTSIHVLVSDPQGSVVPGASVTIKNTQTGEKRTAITNDEGEAVFPAVPTGTYDLLAEQAGFARKSLTGLQVKVGAETRITLTLSVGTVAETLVEKKEQEEQISALPNINNDLTPLLEIVPGSVATGSAALGRVVIDGKGNDQQTVRLDGVDFQVLSELPSADTLIDGLGSFQKPEVAGDLDGASTQTRAFAPRFGPGTGAVSETLTYRGDSGAEGWKAQIYGDYRNDAFNARNFFDYEGKNGLRRSRFGAKGGGPLTGNKGLQMFIGFDGILGRAERNVYEAIPADAACGCATGPLAETIRGFLPAGTQVIPGASLNPDFVVARRRVRTNAESWAGNIRFDFSPFIGETKDGKATPRSKDLFTIRFTQQAARNIVPDGVTGRQQRQRVDFSNGFASFLVAREFSTHTFRLGFNRVRAHIDTEIPLLRGVPLDESVINTSGTVKTFGLPGAPPTVPVATLGGLIKNLGRGFDLEPRSLSLAYDYFKLFRARDEVRVGLEARFIRMNLNRLGGLTYSFPNVAALRSGTPGSVTYLSDLSGPSPFSQGSGPRQARQQYVLGYLQLHNQIGNASTNPANKKDESQLLLTYGVRYDYFTAVREPNNRAVLVDPANGQFLPARTPFYQTAKWNFQPRFGIAYRFGKAGAFANTVVRGGVGVYSGVPRTGDLALPIESDRFSTGIIGGTFPANPADVISGFINNPDARRFQPVTFSRSFTALERLYKWEGQLTQTFQGYGLSLLYTGNIGRNLPLANVTNKIVSVTTNPDPTKPAIVVREFDVIRGGQVFQPFGEFLFRTGGGHSSYNGVTISFARNVKAKLPDKPSHWLQSAVANFSVQYTYSRNEGNVSGTVASNPFNFESDSGFNTANVPHNFKISAVYDLWTAKNRRSPANPLWGWKIMPSFKASSGFPLVVRLSRPDVVYLDAAGNVFSSPAVGRTAVINTPGGGESANARVPDIIPGVDPFLRSGLGLLNPAAFSIPSPGKFGNFKRGSLRGPSVAVFDLGLRRNLFNDESRKISGQFQIDFYNIFNRANFLNPTAALPNALGTSAADNQHQPGMPFTRASAGTFGIITAADTGRLIQFSLTLRINDGFTK